MIFVFLNTAKSKLLIPFARSEASTRDSVPYPHAGGAAKQDLAQHEVHREVEQGGQAGVYSVRAPLAAREPCQPDSLGSNNT